jgi:hypothetical protein
MKNFLIVLIFNFTLLTLNLFAQSQFQWRIGGTGQDYARSIIQTTDGGYVAAGRTQSFGAGSDDMYIIKLDASGNLQWSRTIGGAGYDEANSIIQTTDGGYAVAGSTQSFGAGNRDMYIIKLNGSGTLQWSRTVGGTNLDAAYSIIQTTDGGYAVAGFNPTFGAGNSDFYIVKFDSSGTLLWSKTAGGGGLEYAFSIIQTTDGGYAVAGSTTTFGAGSGDMYIVKLDASGNLQWSRTIGGTMEEFAYSIIQTTDGGYAVAGRTQSFGAGNNDMYIVKLDASGNLQWSRTVGRTSSDEAYSIIQTTDGGYAVAGFASDMYIVKLNSSGTLQWSRTVGGTNTDYAFSIIQTTDGGYALAGYTFSFGAGSYDMYIVTLDTSGNTCGNSTTPLSISGTGGTLGTPTSILNSPTSTVTTPTPTTNTGGTVTAICTAVGIQPVSNEMPNQFSLSQNYPNPFNPSTVIKFQVAGSSSVKLVVFDALGQEVETLVNDHLSAGTYEVDFDGTNYPSGVYFYQLKTNEFIETKKMLMIK